MRFAKSAQPSAETAACVRRSTTRTRGRGSSHENATSRRRHGRAQLAELRAESARRAAREAEAQAIVAQQQAAAASQRGLSATERAALLERELRDLAVAKSDRGMVVTLNDVLFDPDSATLRPADNGWSPRIAEFLREYPDRTIAIEGFTDSAGADAQNQELSERRATAVRLGLINSGVDGSRVFVRGYGKRVSGSRATIRAKVASAIAASRS
jgi:outer membrane protein OmpA-like peptidoglycan-associated protein